MNPSWTDDNPYSEAQFKTLKYRPGFPDRFGSIEDARTFCADFFAWYNGEHRHSGIALFTPADVQSRPDGPPARGPRRRPRRRLRRPPRPLRQGSTPAQAGACRGLDQPTREGGAASLIFRLGCLTALDRFRFHEVVVRVDSVESGSLADRQVTLEIDNIVFRDVERPN